MKVSHVLPTCTKGLFINMCLRGSNSSIVMHVLDTFTHHLLPNTRHAIKSHPKKKF